MAKMTNTKRRTNKPPSMDDTGQAPLANLTHEYVVRAYIKLGSKPKAVKSLGYKVSNVQIFNRKDVKDRVAYLLMHHLSFLGLTNERVLYENLCVASSNPQDMLDDNGNMLNIKDMPEHAARAISGFDQVKETTKAGKVKSITTKVRLHPKNPAVETFMKHKGMFEKDKTLELKGDLVSLLAEIGQQTAVLPRNDKK